MQCLAVDESRRKLIAEVETLRSQQKAANNEMASLPKGSPEFLEKVTELKSVSAAIKDKDTELKDLDSVWNERYLSVPNLPDASVPEGRDESDNVEIKQWGEIPEVQSYHLPHYDFEWLDQILDFKRGDQRSLAQAFLFLLAMELDWPAVWCPFFSIRRTRPEFRK